MLSHYPGHGFAFVSTFLAPFSFIFETRLRSDCYRAIATGLDSPVSTGPRFPHCLLSIILPWLGQTSLQGPHTIVCVLEYKIPGVETSEMAANSMKESLPRLADEPHPPKYFPFLK